MDGPETLRAAQTAAADGRFDEALVLARSALQLGLDRDARPSERGELVSHPETALAESVAAIAGMNLGRLDEALVHAARAVVADPGTTALCTRGLVQHARGDRAAALTDLTAALAHDPTSCSAHYHRARCFAELGQLVEAERDVGFVLRANPLDDNARALFDEVRAAQGLPHADADLPQPQTAHQWLARASLFAQRGDHAGAAAAYDHLLALTPAQTVLRAYRGASLEALGDFSRARDDYEAFLAVDPSNAWTIDALARVRARLCESPADTGLPASVPPASERAPAGSVAVTISTRMPAR
jgi:tetratricopeptide (TPR) repeat protein